MVPLKCNGCGLTSLRESLSSKPLWICTGDMGDADLVRRLAEDLRDEGLFSIKDDLLSSSFDDNGLWVQSRRILLGMFTDILPVSSWFEVGLSLLLSVTDDRQLFISETSRLRSNALFDSSSSTSILDKFSFPPPLSKLSTTLLVVSSVVSFFSFPTSNNRLTNEIKMIQEKETELKSFQKRISSLNQISFSDGERGGEKKLASKIK